MASGSSARPRANVGDGPSRHAPVEPLSAVATGAAGRCAPTPCVTPNTATVDGPRPAGLRRVAGARRRLGNPAGRAADPLVEEHHPASALGTPYGASGA